MEPVKRSHHNKTYKGPTEDIGDLSTYAVEGRVASHWRPNSEEVAVLVRGGDVEVTIFGEPIPPITVGIIEGEVPLALPTDPESEELVMAAGLEFRVPPPVAAELKAEREGVVAAVVEKLATLEVGPDDTIILTVPDGAGPEMTEAILAGLSQQFPENRGCVLPESLGLHAKENFATLLEAGSEMAKALGSGLPDKAIEWGRRWNELTHG